MKTRLSAFNPVTTVLTIPPGAESSVKVEMSTTTFLPVGGAVVSFSSQLLRMATITGADSTNPTDVVAVRRKSRLELFFIGVIHSKEILT